MKIDESILYRLLTNLGKHGYILKNSINDKGEVSDNLELAKSYLQVKIDEINSFMDKNSKFL